MSSAVPIKFLLTPAELAAGIGVSPKTLRNWRAKGLGPVPTRLSPKDVRYAVDDVQEWIKSVKRADSAQYVSLFPGDAA